MDAELHQILYTSAAARPMGQTDLEQILDASRRSNAEHQITGLLLYHNESFMQVLEGARGAIRALFHERIARDGRHRSVTLILDEPLPQRAFGNWSMGFARPHAGVAAPLEGFSDFLARGTFQDGRFGDRPSLAQHFMLLFRAELAA